MTIQEIAKLPRLCPRSQRGGGVSDGGSLGLVTALELYSQTIWQSVAIVGPRTGDLEGLELDSHAYAIDGIGNIDLTVPKSHVYRAAYSLPIDTGSVPKEGPEEE